MKKFYSLVLYFFGEFQAQKLFIFLADMDYYRKRKNLLEFF